MCAGEIVLMSSQGRNTRAHTLLGLVSEASLATWPLQGLRPACELGTRSIICHHSTCLVLLRSALGTLSCQDESRQLMTVWILTIDLSADYQTEVFRHTAIIEARAIAEHAAQQRRTWNAQSRASNTERRLQNTEHGNRNAECRT